jgi:hypothetical protein
LTCNYFEIIKLNKNEYMNIINLLFKDQFDGSIISSS